MHLFYNASQIVKKKMVILVDLSAIYLASPLSIMAWFRKKLQMAWLSKMLSPFKGPNRLAALLPLSDITFQYHNE